MRTYLGHLIRNTWFTLTWETLVALIIFSSCITTINLISNGILVVTGTFLAFTTLVILIIIPLVELTKNYWKTLYRDQGLFTHTLPITKGKIFTAHAIWFFICTTISQGIFATAVFSWIMIQVGSAPATVLAQIKQGLFTYKGAILFYLLSVLINSICASFSFLASISVGMHSRLYSRLGIAGPVLVAVVVLIIEQILIFLGALTIRTLWDSKSVLNHKVLIQMGAEKSLHYLIDHSSNLMVYSSIPLIPLTIFMCYLAIRFLNRNLSVGG